MRPIMAKAISYLKPDIDPNMRLYVPFNEGTGSIAKDYSQYGNHAQLTDVEWSPDGFNGAGKFNGTSAFGGCGNDASLNITDAITIEVRVKPTAGGQIMHSPIVIKQKDTIYMLGYSNSSSQIKMVIDSAASSGTTPSTNIWNHIIGVYNGTDIRIYLNEVLQGTPTSKTGNIPSGNTLRIGWYGAVNRFFNGTINEVRIYNRALSAAQIAADCYGVVCS